MGRAPNGEPSKSPSVVTVPARGCGKGEVGHSDEAGREPVPYGREQDRTDDQAKLPTFRDNEEEMVTTFVATLLFALQDFAHKL
uniref:Uncharacterized protein n=1 Tax=Aegilops tauschii TaxID=37682 RepID=M8CCU1_AEGTA